VIALAHSHLAVSNFDLPVVGPTFDWSSTPQERKWLQIRYL
jgi:hypothetical protein